VPLPTFSLNEKEAARAKEWLEEHSKKHIHRRHLGEGRGGTISYEFTPTGIGDAVKVKCACGGSVDVTDFDSW